MLVRDAPDPVGTIVGFHGYGQTAETMLSDLERIPGIDRWRVVSVQALHRFYGRDNQTIMASWMTRQDRELAIADNVEYVNRVVDAIALAQPLDDPEMVAENPINPVHLPTPLGSPASTPLVFAGFSQGVAMAYRAALLGHRPAAGIIALGGDLPPEFKAADPHRRWPPVLIGVGSRDIWYTETKSRLDEQVLVAQHVEHEIVRFDGGHEWAPAFLDAAARWLSSRGD